MFLGELLGPLVDLGLHLAQELELGKWWDAIAEFAGIAASTSASTSTSAVLAAGGAQVRSLLHFERVEQPLQLSLRSFLSWVSFKGGEVLVVVRGPFEAVGVGRRGFLHGIGRALQDP